MKKIQFQPRCSVTSPPTRGPMASAVADTPAQMPIAVPRSRAGNVAEMIDSVAGVRSAAPAPWTTRAPIRKASEEDRPHISDAAVNTTSPIEKKRRRPK
jgi:hypothetical protein